MSKPKNMARKRYLCLCRVSNDSDGTSSTEAQLDMQRAFGDAREMIYVDKIMLEGVTGSMPGKRADLAEIVKRKRTKNDFDVLLVQRLDRLTRSGSGHGFWFEHECRCAGIEILFVGDEIPEGRYANLIKVMKYEAAQEQAFSISQRSTQGSQHAIEQGRNVTSTHTPFGCWRLYLSADGRPNHIIRDCGDGRQQKLDPQTYAVVDTYGEIGGRKGQGRYRKQKSELVRLMPGDAEEVAVVREIFDLHYRSGFGGKRIADVLNRRGVRSPWGKTWSQHQVESIYEQAAYTGRTIGNRMTAALYHERSPNAPKVVEINAELTANAERLPWRHRPRGEWFIQDQPLLIDFLDADVREMARAAQEAIWADRGNPDRPKKPRNRHNASDYLLSGILRAKQDGETLVGVLCGRVGEKVRYYRHRRGRRGYMKDSIFNRLIRADFLENAVLQEVEKFFGAMPDLDQRIAALIATTRERPDPSEGLDAMRGKRDRLRKRVEMIIASFDEADLKDAQAELARLRAERQQLDESIAQAEANDGLMDADPEAIALAIKSRLASLSANMADMPIAALRDVLRTLVSKAEVDLETREVRLQLSLPLDPNAMRLVGSSASSTSYQTHHVLRLDLAILDCAPVKIAKQRCYRCRRSAA